MNLLESIKSQREKLDAKENAAIAERNAFIASIGEAAGRTHNGTTISDRRKRRNMKIAI